MNAGKSKMSVPYPRRPVDVLLGPVERFLHVESAAGVLLLACAVLALAVANSPWGESFLAFWQTSVGVAVGRFEFRHSLLHWINDGLMVLFFFVVGLEIKRELVDGELQTAKKAALPLAAALGGMMVPALIFLSMQGGEPASRGWGIPMATDIAFVVGCLALLGRRIPHGFRVFLLSLAIVDDIGAVLVIAVGYTEELSISYLLLGGLLLVLIVLLERLGVRSYGVYTVVGAGVWFCFHESGVHATVAGVLLGLLTPARPYLEWSFLGRRLRELGNFLHGDPEKPPVSARDLENLQRLARDAASPLEVLEIKLHPWVSFVIMPLFALANAGVVFDPADLVSPVAMAVGLGLLLGKPVGIALFSWSAVRLGWAELPENVVWTTVIGGGILAGIGFTMALFIANLALAEPLLSAAKIGVLSASALAALLGLLWLRLVTPEPREA